VRVERVNEGDEGEGIYLVDFIYLHEIEQEISCNCFKCCGDGVEGERQGGDVTNVQYRSNWNCHYECPSCIKNTS
jgi:hypothetical protein